MGPLELADMVGLDILLEVMETFYNDLGDTKYRPAHLLAQDGGRGLPGPEVRHGLLPVREPQEGGRQPHL